MEPKQYVEMESKRSIVLHELMKGTWNVNFVSPIEQELKKRNDFKVLDIGCGTGAFLLQLSKDYPSAKFVGLDKVSELLPNGHLQDNLQDNLQFIQGDVLKGLPFEDDSFDFVHMRFLRLAFTEEQWSEQVIKELIRVCKPGGWVEILDIEEFKSLSPTSKRLLISVMSNFGPSEISSINGDDVLDLLSNNNQVDEIYSDERFIPIGNWGGYFGELSSEMFTLTFNQLSHYITIRLGVRQKELEMMIKQFAKDIEYYRSYFITTRICCRKVLM